MELSFTWKFQARGFFSFCFRYYGAALRDAGWIDSILVLVLNSAASPVGGLVALRSESNTKRNRTVQRPGNKRKQTHKKIIILVLFIDKITITRSKFLNKEKEHILRVDSGVRQIYGKNSNNSIKLLPNPKKKQYSPL